MTTIKGPVYKLIEELGEYMELYAYDIGPEEIKRRFEDILEKIPDNY